MCTRLNGFFDCKWLNSSFLPINGTPTGTTIPGQSEPWNDSYEGVSHIPQISWTAEYTDYISAEG